MNSDNNCGFNRAITPDSMTGMVFAAEGIADTVTLINGPMGCKFYHSTTSGFLTVRPPLYLPVGSKSGDAENDDPAAKKVPVSYQFLDSWFFRQARVPCTWLDGDDYIYGTSDQVRGALRYLRDNVSLKLLVIVDSPGASLIGDDLSALCAEELPDVKCVILESPGYSQTFDDGYLRAGLEILEQGFEKEINGPGAGAHLSRADRVNAVAASSAPAAPSGVTPRRPRVNLLGLTIWQRYYEGDKQELIRLFDLIGADVHTAFLAGSSPEEISTMGEADLNIVIDRSRGLSHAKWLKEKAGTPYYVFDELPIGFAAVEKAFKEIAAILGTGESSHGAGTGALILRTDADALIKESERARALAYTKIRAIHELSGLPEGALYHVAGDPAQVRAYGAFLREYLGMVETSLEEAELVFGDANTIASLMTRRDAFCGIEINYPGMGYTDLIPKTHLGIQGALFLIEQVLNGLMSKL